MACDLTSTPMVTSFILTESPFDDSTDDSTESDLIPKVKRFISGQPAQSYNVYNSHLPYASSLQLEAANYLKEIKSNLGKCILLSAHKSDCFEIKTYISLYGHYFTKEDHILLIKMFLQCMQIPGIEMSTLTGMISTLNSLLRKQRLISPKELTIEWRPLYDIYCKYIFERKNLFQMGQSYGFESNLRNLIEISRNYFSIEATREILDELRPVQCPFAACKIFRCSFLLGLFLPTQMFPEDHEKGFKLWFDEILALWSGPNALQYENIFFKLLSRLATHNIGYIDWSPYMSTIFTKYTKAMNNSVSQSPIALLALTTDCTPLVNWIVSMIGGNQSTALQYIEALFKAVESNFHPSNMSRWNAQLTNILSRLSSAFITRIHKERYSKKTWEFRTPKEYQITEEEIDKFVDILQPILLTAMFSRFGTHSVFTSIRDLAWLRPEKVVPPLVEKLYIALDSNLEAHRLNSLMSALSMVAPVMVDGLDRYEEGKTHLISLLFASLPGLDCNDIKKCGNTCGLISHLIDSVPIMDCSAMVDIRNDLTETEYNIALETSRFEEFVLIFLEKVLTLVENYAPEHRPEKIDNDPVKQSSDESYFESSMVFALSMVLIYSSPPIFSKALDQLFIFLRGRLFESRSTIKMMTTVCGLFARADPKTVLEKFLPYLHSTILGLTDNEDVFGEESVDPQLLLALQISSEIIVEGHYIEQHADKICDIIRRGLKLKPNQGYKSAACLLKNCLESLTTVYPNPKTTFSLSWEQLSDFANINPIRLWGKHDKPEDTTSDWYMPSEKEIKLTQKLLDEFLIPELQSLHEWTKGERTLTREEVHRSLHVVLFCVAGSTCVLPPFDSDEYVIFETAVPPPHERVHEIGTPILTLSSGSNPRQLIAESARTTLKHITANCDDDTKSLDLIIRIYQCVMGWTKSSRSMKSSRDHYNTVKKNLKNKLMKVKRLPRRIIIERIRLQHEMRISAKTWGKFTTLHRDIVLDLFSLALSHYSDVRAKAHGALLQFKHQFGYRLIASELTRVFTKPRTGETEEIQGALSILLNHYSSFMSISDWACITPLWLALINTDYSEKPIIIALLEQLSKHAANKLQPLLIEFKISPELHEIAKQFFTTGILPEIEPPNESAIEQGKLACDLANKVNYELYVSFVHKLVDSIETGQLHWRHLQFAFLLLQSLIRKDIKFPIEGVRIIVKNLINDHISIRRICINGVAAILKQHKPEIEFHYAPVNLNADQSSEYDWLYFKPEVDYMDETIWKQVKWVNRTFISPNYVPTEGIKYYTEASAFPARTVDSVSPEEAVILEFFLDKTKITKLLDFITLDDKKASLLGPRRFKMFQGIFRNFGVTLIDVFRDFFENMTTETKENVHRCGCDVLTGLVRGSKYWPYKDMLTARDLLEPVIKKILKIISRETTEVYVEFCMFGFRRLDGRRYSWLFRYLIEDPLSSNDTTATSFQSFSRLKILSDLLISQCWRAIPYLRHLFDHIMKNNHLKNPYQNIRQLIGCSLTQLLQFDNDFFNSTSKPLKDAPKITELLTSVLPELEAASLNDPLLSSGFPSSSTSSTFNVEPLESSALSSPSSSVSSPMVVVDSSGNSIEDVEKESCNLLTTLCYWLHPHLSLNPYITRPQILQLVPIISEIKNRSKDDELTASANEALNSIGQCSINEKYIDSALAVCKKMTGSKSWHTRVSVVTFIQLMVSSNLFTLMNDLARNKMVSSMIIDLLQDDRMEVREKAAELLGGLVHYQFIKVDKHLINQFKLKCARKLTRSTINFGYDSNELNEKHGGALGLCSIVSAYPYDVPEFLPDILMFLSDHLHDPQPIPTTIRKTLSDFKRTHHDNWRQHKEKFNEDQLAIITDLLVSPNYYA